MNDPNRPAFRDEVLARAARLLEQFPAASNHYLACSLAYELDMKVEAIEAVLDLEGSALRI